MTGLKTLSPTETVDFERVDAKLVEAARPFGTATLHEAGGKIGALPPQIKPMAPSFKVCGPAFTVEGPPGDNLRLHRALAAARPGDVIVAAVGGVHEYGYWGEIMSTAGKALGLAGLVIDGCVRDGALLEGVGFPVFARGLCIRGTGKDFEARAFLGHPLLIGDVTVHPGDLVCGDVDGVCVVPRARAAEIIQKSLEREAKEAKVMDQLRGGATTLDLYGWNR